ncbi:MAG: THUMP domain-containing class I SAM-dependent RNA methyltransferase [Bacteroidia bacterium]
MTETKNYTAKTQAGLEHILAEELKTVGAENIVPGVRSVTFSGDKKVMYKANLWCRTAIRILVPVKTFPCENENMLYAGVGSLPWSKFMTVDGTLAVDGVTIDSNIDHSYYAALKTKDAIVDQFRNKVGKRPDVDVANPDLRVNVHISKDVCTISLDSSGESLHKRGYRKHQGIAPLNEVLAAGLIMLSGWKGDTPFIDPMCGSGTLPVEAALIAANIAPGQFRFGFGFQTWKDYDEELWQSIKNEAEELEKDTVTHKIIASDISDRAIKMTSDNAKSAGVAKFINFQTTSFKDLDPPTEPGVVIINPPYGERIKVEELGELYSEIGDTLKKKYPGYNGWILTSNRDAAKNIGLKPSKKIVVYNGALECRFLKFELFKGKHKEHVMEEKGKIEKN